MQTITREKIILFVILALALIARFRYLIYIEHNIDQAYPIWQALNTLDNGVFPTVGQGTSVLFANAPMTGYVYLPIVALTRAILGVEILVIALNTLAVWMAYRLATYLIPERWALLVALIMAVNPFIIEYSRATWVQSLLPFYATALLWQFTPVLLKRTRYPMRRTIITAILFGVVANSYLLAFLWGVSLGLLVLIFHKRLDWRAVGIGVGIVVLMTLPYALTLLSDWEALQTDVRDFGRNPPQFNIEAWGHAVRLVTGGEYEIVRGFDAPIQDSALRHALSQPFHWLGMILIVIGIARALWSIYRRAKDADGSIIALVWFSIPIVAMTYTGNLVHPFYQLLSVPIGAVLLVLGMKTLSTPIPVPIQSRLAWVGGIVVCFWAGLMVVNHARFSQETMHTPGAHGLGALPISAGLALADKIRPVDGIVYADMPEWVMNSFVGYTFALVRDNRAPQFMIYPPEGGVYLTVGEDKPLLVDSDVLTLSDNTRIYIHRLPPQDRLIDLIDVRWDVPTVQGLRLMGYTLRDDMIRIVWQVDFVVPEVKNWIIGTFIHVYNADGERIINTSGGALEGWRWRVGEIYIDQIPLDLPKEGAPFTIHLGGYDGVHHVNLQFDFPNDDLPASTAMVIDNIYP